MICSLKSGFHGMFSTHVLLHIRKIPGTLKKLWNSFRMCFPQAIGHVLFLKCFVCLFVVVVFFVVVVCLFVCLFFFFFFFFFVCLFLFVFVFFIRFIQ